MARPPSSDPKRPPHPIELQRLDILRKLTANRCRRLGCSRQVCRRTGRCRALARTKRRFALDQGIDNATSWRIINAMRELLGSKPLGDT